VLEQVELLRVVLVAIVALLPACHVHLLSRPLIERVRDSTEHVVLLAPFLAAEVGTKSPFADIYMRLGDVDELRAFWPSAALHRTLLSKSGYSLNDTPVYGFQ